MPVPDDSAVINALTIIREEEPNLARGKILKQLREENDWQISEKRLKDIMNSNHLSTPLSLPTEKSRDGPAYDAIVKAAFEDFASRERNFMLSLSASDAREVVTRAPSGATLTTMAAINMRHHVEILLTLKGFKPCTGMYHFTATHIFERMVEQCLKPVMQTYGLANYGFELRKIEHAVNIGSDVFWKGGLVFADNRSPLFDEVIRVLLPDDEKTLPSEGMARNMYEDSLAKVFGYPVRSPRTESRNDVRYMDETENQNVSLALKTQVGPVIGFEYFDDEGTEATYRSCYEHFNKCAEAMKSVGRELSIELQGHEKLQEYFDSRGYSPASNTAIRMD